MATPKNPINPQEPTTETRKLPEAKLLTLSRLKQP
jgi:hypothetical protein